MDKKDTVIIIVLGILALGAMALGSRAIYGPYFIGVPITIISIPAEPERCRKSNDLIEESWPTIVERQDTHERLTVLLNLPKSTRGSFDRFLS
jgi:hypothetical protein